MTLAPPDHNQSPLLTLAHGVNLRIPHRPSPRAEDHERRGHDDRQEEPQNRNAPAFQQWHTVLILSEIGQSFMKLRSRLESLQIEFEKEFPKDSGKIGLLDEPVLALIMEKLPISREEWTMEIPLDIRQEIDGRQARQYMDQVLEVIDEMTL